MPRAGNLKPHFRQDRDLERRVLCRRPHSPPSQLTSVWQLSSEALKASLPLSTSTPIHRVQAHSPNPQLSQVAPPALTWRVGDPGPTTGRQKTGVSRRKVPLGSFLCGPLGFLSCSHLPKIMAMWGQGRGGKSAWREGHKVPEASAAVGPVQAEVLQTPDLRKG